VVRRGKKRAAVAVGHSILVIAYHLLTEDSTYQDLGVHDFDQRQQQAVERRLVRRLADPGYKVTLEPPAAERCPRPDPGFSGQSQHVVARRGTLP
jgi:hypothetical protein